MIKIFTVILTFFFFVKSSFGQLNSTNHTIIDNIGKQPINQNSLKRSAQAPIACDRDTVEYPRWKATTQLNSVTINKGRGLGQLYSTPKPLTLYGFTFYAIIATTPPATKKLRLICNVYKAGLDSLPMGLPLRSDTVTIDSAFAGSFTIDRVEEHATFKTPIYLDSAFILTVESDSANLNGAVVTNNYAAGNGRKENLNCGSISGVWYNGKNLNIGGTPFDADILLHPHVKYSLGADFTIKNQCYALADTIKFTNLSTKSMVGSKMYNLYQQYYGHGNWCNLWNTGNGTGFTYSVDHKVKYNQKQNYKIQLISTVYGYRPAFNGCSDTTSKWLYYKPDFPMVSGPLNACIGDTAKYTVTNADTGAVYEWYKKITDSNPFFKGTVYNKFPLVKTDTFYVKGNNHGCYTGYRTLICNVNAYPTSLTVKDDSICSGAKANLKGFTNTGNVEWYENATGGPVIYSGNVFQTPVLFSDTFFYVQANNKGCIKSPRIKVNALVGSNFAPAPPTITNDTDICISSTSILTLNASAGSGLTIRWFDAGSGSASIGTGNTFYFTPSVREVKTFYADAYNGVCGSTRIPVVITVEDYPKISKKYSDTVCNGDSLIMRVEIPFGEATWYDAVSGGNLLYTGDRYALMTSTTNNYFVETVSGVCKSPARAKMDGVVNTFPIVDKAWADTICAKNKATLKSKLTGQGTMHWYEYDTSSVELGQGKTFQTMVLNGSKNFYGKPGYAGCYGPMMQVSPLVKPIPFPGFSYEVFPFTKSVKVAAISPGTSSYLWDFDDGATSILSTLTHAYTSYGTYNISLTLTEKNGCSDTKVIPVIVAASGIQSPGKLPFLQVYPNPAQGELIIHLGKDILDADVALYAIHGSLIMQGHKAVEDNKILLDVNALLPGLYVLKINGYQASIFVKE